MLSQADLEEDLRLSFLVSELRDRLDELSPGGTSRSSIAVAYDRGAAADMDTTLSPQGSSQEGEEEPFYRRLLKLGVALVIMLVAVGVGSRLGDTDLPDADLNGQEPFAIEKLYGAKGHWIAVPADGWAGRNSPDVALSDCKKLLEHLSKTPEDSVLIVGGGREFAECENPE
jgi:hypothetical protein